MYTTNDNPTGTRFIVLDCEFVKDQRLYDKYRRIDPRPANCRWPFKRVVSVSAMAIEIQGSQLEVTALQSWSGADEARLLMQLFRFLGAHPVHKLCTYGGVATDLPILRTAAMANGLKLPPQLRTFDRGQRTHFDLAIAMKAGAGEYVHLTEICTRLQLPCKMAESAAAVPHLAGQGRFRAIEYISESDVISTALVLAEFLSAQGELLSAKAAQLSIIRHVRERRAKALYNRLLGNVADRLRQEISAELNIWMARVA